MDGLTRTLIGVTASLKETGTHSCGSEYLTALTAHGALPVVLPVTEDEALLQMLKVTKEDIRLMKLYNMMTVM